LLSQPYQSSLNKDDFSVELVDADDDDEDEFIDDDDEEGDDLMDDSDDENEEESDADSTMSVYGDVEASEDIDILSEEEMLDFLHASTWDQDLSAENYAYHMNRGKEFDKFVSKLKNLGSVPDSKLIQCDDLLSMNLEESSSWRFRDSFLPRSSASAGDHSNDSLGKRFFDKMSSNPKEIYRSNGKSEFPNDDDDKGGLKMKSSAPAPYISDDREQSYQTEKPGDIA
jgi:hypothetical protein